MSKTSESTPDRPIYERPTPVIGDATSAADRAGDVAGWAFDEPTQEALHRVIGARRDIRRYRPDPVPPELVHRVLEAGHGGPSVGHSQPWRFIVIEDANLRARAAVLADSERLKAAADLTPERGAQLLDLKLEGVREAPLGIVVACDRRTPASGVLGRRTFADADLWSCAAAIENMWLTARAAGLGMGWVTLFEPADLAELLGLPDGVETLGWLCLGWPDERPPGPGLERRAWSKKLPLDEVVLRDRWPATSGAEPAPPPSGLRLPEQSDYVAATDASDALLTPPGSLGKLDVALDRISAVGAADVSGGTLVIVAADHPVAGLGVSAFPASVTHEVVTAAVAGEALGVATARSVGIDSLIVDAGVAGAPIEGVRQLRPTGPRGDLASAPALTVEDVQQLLEGGRELGREAGGHGVVALGEVGVGNTTVAAALAAALLGIPVEAAVGQGASSDSDMVARKCSVVTDALARVGDVDQRDPLALLAELGGPEFAVLVGVVLGAAEVGAPVVLDGLATSVPALIAVRLDPAVQARLVAGQVSREHAHQLVLAELGLEPLLDLRLRAGEGVGAALATQLLLSGLQMRRIAARTR